MDIGTKIRNERNHQGLSQKELAKRVGISEPAIRNYELGNRIPSEKVLEKIADALDISPFVISNPSLDSYHGIIHSFFYLENTIDLQPVEIEGRVYLSIPSVGNASYEDISNWYHVYQKYQKGEISEEEYKYWKDTYPQEVAINTKSKR